MSSFLSSGPLGAAAGIASGAAGLVKGFVNRATLMQFEYNPDDLSYSAGNSNLIIQFDAVMGDTLTQQSAPTAYPIEDARSITDHITRLPLQIDLIGVVSDTPIKGTKSLFQQEAVVTAATAILPPLAVVGAGFAAGFAAGVIGGDNNASTPSKVALATLQQLQIGNPSAATPVPPRPFTAVSRIGRWPNMMVANLTVPRDVDTGDSLIFQITLVQVIVVKSQTVPLSVLQNSTLAGAKQGLGVQSTSDVPASEQVNVSGAFGSGERIGYGLVR